MNFSNSSIGTIAPVASSCPPPVAPSIPSIVCFVISNAFFPRIEILTFSGRLNATTISLFLWLKYRRFEISADMLVLPEYEKNNIGELSSNLSSAFSTCLL